MADQRPSKARKTTSSPVAATVAAPPRALDELVSDMILRMLCCLHPRDVVTTSAASKSMRRLSTDDVVWCLAPKKKQTTTSATDEADDEEQDAIARKLAVELAVEADDTRAKDVRVLQVSKAVYYARYVVLATAFNRPQMNAVTSKMRDVANNETYNLQIPKNVANQGDWTCLDCRDVVAHVFTPTARTYYDLEDLYRECDEVGLPFETERTHDGFYAEEDGDFYENEDEDESEDLEDEFEINWSEM